MRTSSMKKRIIIDKILNGITYLFSSGGVFILVLIFVFIFSNGARSISLDLLTEDYYSEVYTLKYTDELKATNVFEHKNREGESFSSVWGVGFVDSQNLEGDAVVEISYIDPSSPLKSMLDASTNVYTSIEKGQMINKGVLVKEDGGIAPILSRDSAKTVAEKFDNAVSITNLSLSTDGGGIRGSLIATFMLIVITLAIALPIGICAAIYLSVYARKNKRTYMLEAMIDMTGGVPSIIFGLVGVIVFIPILNKLISSDGVSIMAGALTLSIMLLPVIIKTTKEAIDVIPESIIQASLALGASQTQTTFKVILPNAIPGILTSTLLGIGRIIGESAALIFVVGAQVSDNVSVNRGATTLATHIWNLLGGETPNFRLACAISIVILTVVLMLNVFVKIVGKRLNKFERT